MKSIVVFVASGLLAFSALAKLPALSDDAKAKAAEAAAKTAHAGKMDGYLLCKSQDKVASRFRKAAPVATPPCADPGPFVYTAAAPAPAATPAGAPAPAAPEKKKKKKS